MNPRATPTAPTARLAAPRTELAYYTIADAAYFVGLAGLLGSLRRVGERAPLFVVDCGLTAGQRARLAPLATVLPREPSLHPILQKGTGPLAHPAETMVLIDADILVTRPLDPLIDAARTTGGLVAVEDVHNHDRFFEAWSTPEIGHVERRPYVNAGLLVLSWEQARELLPVFLPMQHRLDLGPTFLQRGPEMRTHPYYYLEQDLLNALLCSRYGDRATRLDHRLCPVPPFAGVEVVPAGLPLCTGAGGTNPFALHHIHRKPWLAPVPPNAYSRLLAALLADPESELRPDPSELPLRLRQHPLAGLDRLRASGQHAASRRLRGKLGLRPRLRRLRTRLGHA